MARLDKVRPRLADKLQSPPAPPAAKLWSVQVLRFVAALLVVFYHAVNYTFQFSHRYGLTGQAGAFIGRCGVDIFFVISGFIITRTSGGLSVGRFVARRAKRILPLYFLFAAFWTLLYATLSHISWRAWLATWLLWPATDQMTPPLVTVAWTLSFEILFYAAFALAIWRRQAVWAIGAIFLAALALRSNPVLQFLGNPIILEFLAGVGLAYAPKWRPAVWGIPIGAAILVLGAVLGWPPYGSIVGDLSGQDGWIRLADLGVPAALIVWGALQIEARESVFTYLGDASYALYLVHVPIVIGAVALMTRLAGAPADVTILAVIALSLVMGWRVHELFEKPVLAWLGQFGRTAAKAPQAGLAS
jgi:exopolysaccharide production protein ExoZ